jgi:hypothetical protein
VKIAGQKVTRRQKDISRLLREKKYNSARRLLERQQFPVKKRDKGK